MNEIRIDKNLCKIGDTLHVIKMPETSTYAGYCIYTPSRLCSIYDTFVALRERKGTGIFTLYKMNRLPTERISQTKRKITFKDLQSELAEHSLKFSDI